MDPARIAALLQPFLAAESPAAALDGCHSEPASAGEESAALTPSQLRQISTYVDVLLQWNARINLTAVRQPDQIVTRHFGESLFAARHLFARAGTGLRPVQADCSSAAESPAVRVIDIGSGAGFPGLPLRIWAAHIRLTLIESNHKKATFLREVIRSLILTNVDVFPGRAESYPAQAEVVTLRAVERFDAASRTASRLVAPAGRLALLIGQAQVDRAVELIPSLRWSKPIRVPFSSSRMLLIGVSWQHQDSTLPP